VNEHRDDSPDLGRDGLSTRIAEVLPTARWFGDKDRQVASVTVDDLVAGTNGGVRVGWALATVHFADGGHAEYGVPFVVREGEFIPDAADEAFVAWWIGLVASGVPVPSERGELTFTVMAGEHPWLAAAEREAGRVLAVEQSNTSIRYGDIALAKVFRRLGTGVNPDVEITTRLAERTGFAQIARPLAQVDHQADQREMTVGFVQAWVPNLGDGWSWILGALHQWTSGAPNSGEVGRVSRRGMLAAMRALGERTGELHVALATAGDDPPFVPELLSDAAIDTLVKESVRLLEQTLQQLVALESNDPALRIRVERVIAREAELRQRLEGFRSMAGTAAIRVHGDYHLGQVLRTEDDDWVILDFEGEPARPSAERRRKHSVLKDVGGMLRSFAYARGAALRDAAEAGPALPDEALLPWEAEARAAFIDGYRARARRSAVALVPDNDVAFRRALDAWELDKALYEVRYELANRPDWLALPLAALG